MNSLVLTPAACKAVRAISDAGGRPLIVGGAVRDALHAPGGNNRDLDVEVYGIDHDTLVAALHRVGKVDEFGAHFAVISVRIGDETIDVSLPRRDN